MERFRLVIHFHHTVYNIASAYAVMKNADRAVYWFQQTVEDGFNCYPLFVKDPNLDSLRRDARFIDLLKKEKEKFDYYKRTFGTPTPPGRRK